ncbi:Methyltransferase domain protein [Aspergillus sclerotialis]|uniref:Methyltransferase domain protein n=1 Tax=Aspergillus sclerotialis TaxID=2070753 RepID=A0A3A2Z4I3_9EURO|nr:Methyltransferase domain protein [Aspergillus sclerotialis]
MADFTEQNRQYFDKMASTYKDNFANVVESLSNLTRDRRLWMSDKWTDTEAGKGQEIKMLEYACGPGHVSIALAPYVTKVIGLDVSDNMISEFNKNAQEANLSDKMTGRKGDLLAESFSEEMNSPEIFDFDLVVISVALHHFENPGLAMKRLGERLKKGGVCFIIDFVPAQHHEFDKEFAEAGKTVKSHGFSREQTWELFEGAGLSEGFEYEVIQEPINFTKDGKTFEKTIFVAKAKLV